MKTLLIIGVLAGLIQGPSLDHNLIGTTGYGPIHCHGNRCVVRVFGNYHINHHKVSFHGDLYFKVTK